jgi:hypothetical protein
VVAQDAATGKVVGFFLNEVEEPGSKQGLSFSATWCTNDKMKIVLGILGELDEKADPYRKFQVTHEFETTSILFEH